MSLIDICCEVLVKNPKYINMTILPEELIEKIFLAKYRINDSYGEILIVPVADFRNLVMKYCKLEKIVHPEGMIKYPGEMFMFCGKRITIYSYILQKWTIKSINNMYGYEKLNVHDEHIEYVRLNDIAPFHYICAREKVGEIYSVLM